MALTNCLECRKQISDGAEVCPHCGVKCDPDILQKNAEVQRTKRDKSNMRIIKGVLILSPLLLVPLLFPEATRNKAQCLTATYAYSAVKVQGAEYFKSPSTVKFAPYSEAEVIRQIDCHTVEILTYADAQNAFGATVRSKIYAKVVSHGNGSFHLEDVKTLER